MGFNGCCSGASIGVGGFMLAYISACSGVIGFKVGTWLCPVREKVRPARPDVCVSSSVPHSGVTVGGRLVACYGCGHCVNYMPKGSDRWPSSDANLDVIADNRGERPGKTPNWDAPKQRLELLLRT